MRKSTLMNLLRRREGILTLLIALMVIMILFRAPAFLHPENIRRIVNDTSILIIVAIGQFLVILSGGIDLSVGSTIAFSGMAASMLNQAFPQVPVLLVLLAGVLIGTALGFINGAVVAWGNVPPIITTLGTMSIFRGMTFVLSNGQWVTAHEMSEAYMALPHGNFLGLTNLIWTAVLISTVMMFFIRFTRSGREIYAIGGNKVAAKFAGVKDTRVNLTIFTISGALSGLAGVLWTARYAAAVNETASGFELQTVAACVLGGVSIAGGSGAIPGVILGALFLGIINNALPVVNLSPFVQMFIQGAILMLAMLVNVIMAERQENSSKKRRRFA